MSCGSPRCVPGLQRKNNRSMSFVTREVWRVCSLHARTCRRGGRLACSCRACNVAACASTRGNGRLREEEREEVKLQQTLLAKIGMEMPCVHPFKCARLHSIVFPQCGSACLSLPVGFEGQKGQMKCKKGGEADRLGMPALERHTRKKHNACKRRKKQFDSRLCVNFL